MEAVPRLPMLWVQLRKSPEGTSFVKLKKYIGEIYQEDPEAYSKDCYALETLRNTAMHPEKSSDGIAVLKRYYCQLHSLTNRFPKSISRNLFTFTWTEKYSNTTMEYSDIKYEMASVLFNIGALHSQVGASVQRTDVDGMKLACTHFQCAAWCFTELKDRFGTIINSEDFISEELLMFMQQISFAQAQECILEKSLIDNRKPNIVAKVTAQIINYYNTGMSALIAAKDKVKDNASLTKLIFFTEGKDFRIWQNYVSFKVSYLSCVLYLYQGYQAEWQQKMGERLTYYQASFDKLQEASKDMKGLFDLNKFKESITFTHDVVEGKRDNAKKENEFIYHEEVPELNTLSSIQGANLVNGIGFSVTDPEVAGEDIFGRLVPMEAHEGSSLYSEEKAQLLRTIGTKVEEKNVELTTYMSSLSLENLNISEERANKIPQGIVDRCAALNANTEAIPDLIASMSGLAEICAEVESNLKEIQNILTEEDAKEKQYKQTSGEHHRTNTHLTELSKEFQKYNEAHNKACESNDTLRKAMELHVNNLKILSRPLQEIQSSVPKLSNPIEESMFKDLKLILNKANEMRAQREQFHADLRIAINDDDITTKVIAKDNEMSLDQLFKKEITKHDKQVNLIEQNLSAQANILAALTEEYAKTAPLLKTLSDIKHQKENFYSSLAASYDVYEDLLAKSGKGLEFYKKLQGNIQKLFTRIRAARDVQNEDRELRLKATQNVPQPVNVVPATTVNTSNKPKLRDYLNKQNKLASNLPTIRPSPLGSESPTTVANCATNKSNYQSPNEPPPPYTPTNPNQYYSGGYVNPVYQQSIDAGDLAKFASTRSTPSPYAGGYQYGSEGFHQQQPQYPNQQQIPSATPFSQNAVSSTANQGYQNNAISTATSNPTQSSTPTSSFQNQQIQQQPTNYQYSQSNYPQQNYALPKSSSTNLQDQFAAMQQQSYQQFPPNSNYSLTGSLNSIQCTNSQLPQAQQQQSATQVSNYNQQISSAPQQPTSVNSFSQQSSYNPSQLPNSYGQSGNSFQPTGNAVSAAQPSNPYNQPVANAFYQQSSQYNPSQVDAYNQQGYTFQQGSYQPSSVPVSSQGGVPQPPGNYQQSSVPVMSQQSNCYPSQTNLQQPGSYQATNQQSPAPLNNQGSLTPQTQQPGNYQQSSANNQGLVQHHSQQAQSYQPQNPSHLQQNNLQQSALQTNQSLSQQNQNQSYQYSHPGFTFNGSTGNYEYTSGYQSQNNNPLYSQGGVRSSNENKSINSTPNPEALNQQQPVQPTPSQQPTNSLSYYSIQYGQQPSNQSTTFVNQSDSKSSMTYMQSGKGTSVQTTQSETESSKQISKTKKVKTNVKSNVDLLSEIDFSGGPAPLQPAIVSTKAETPLSRRVSLPSSDISEHEPKEIEHIPETPTDLPQISIDRKPSIDNLSLCSEVSSSAFDLDSASVVGETKKPQVNTFDDPKIMNSFVKEVERYEKTIEALNVTMLNGKTPLMNKWKELNDALAKSEPNRSTSIAKLFPEKNRSIDCIPYNNCLVRLERTTDDYINAAFIKNLTLGDIPSMFILGQTPLNNTVNDFWSMIWTQKCRTVVCLHTPNEILDMFWPTELNKERSFDDFSITLVKINDLSNCSEYNLKVTLAGADATLNISLLQLKSWNKTLPAQAVGVAKNIIHSYREKFEDNGTHFPIVLTCLTGSERSGIVAVAICSILATKLHRPMLIDVVDVWNKICSARKNAIKDISVLEFTMNIVLTYAHDLLNKHGVMTSYQMKNAQAVQKDVEDIKDPLNDLDPLWKLK